MIDASLRKAIIPIVVVVEEEEGYNKQIEDRTVSDQRR